MQIMFCALIHIWTKGEVGAVKPVKYIYWQFQGGTSFVDHLCHFCLVFVMRSSMSVYWCLVVICFERADFLALFCDV